MRYLGIPRGESNFSGAYDQSAAVVAAARRAFGDNVVPDAAGVHIGPETVKTVAELGVLVTACAGGAETAEALRTQGFAMSGLPLDADRAARAGLPPYEA